MENMHRHMLHNDRLEEASSRSLGAGQVGLLSGWGVFSTIRVADGVLFAFERHYDRMKRDAAKLHVAIPMELDAMQAHLLRLVEANEAWDATMRVCVVRNRGGLWEGPGVTTDADVVAFTAPLHPWPDQVSLGLKAAARYTDSEFAGTKVLSWAPNLVWYEEAHNRGLGDMLLLNERGDVSECTSANIFAVFGDTVLTPPLDSGCLPGVTRALLLEMQIEGVHVREKELAPEDLEKADQVFITSTTRDLLPVQAIEGLKIRNTGEVAARLEEAIVRYRASYIRTHATARPASTK